MIRTMRLAFLVAVPLVVLSACGSSSSTSQETVGCNSSNVSALVTSALQLQSDALDFQDNATLGEITADNSSALQICQSAQQFQTDSASFVSLASGMNCSAQDPADWETIENEVSTINSQSASMTTLIQQCQSAGFLPAT